MKTSKGKSKHIFLINKKRIKIRIHSTTWVFFILIDLYVLFIYYIYVLFKYDLKGLYMFLSFYLFIHHFCHYFCNIHQHHTCLPISKHLLKSKEANYQEAETNKIKLNRVACSILAYCVSQQRTINLQVKMALNYIKCSCNTVWIG